MEKEQLVAICCSEWRKIYIRARVSENVRATAQKLGIEHKGFHALRHTFATRALECGMDVKTLSEILGHKNATVTLNRYVHSLVEHKQEMMNVLGKLLCTAQSKSRVTNGDIKNVRLIK